MQRVRYVLFVLSLLLLVTPLLPTTAQGGDGTCFSAAPANHLIPRLSIGVQARNLLNGGELGIFSGDAVVGQIPAGGVFTVVDGPHCDANYLWWMVDYNGLTGWVTEGDNINLSYSVEPLTLDHQECAAILHQVVAGETLFSIAQQYGTTAEALASANSMSNPNSIVAGQSLSIPCGSTGSSFTPPDNLVEITADTAGNVAQIFERSVGDFADNLYLYEQPDGSAYMAAMLTDSTINRYSMLTPDAAPATQPGLNNRRIYDVAIGPQGITASAEFDDASSSTVVRVLAGNSRPLDIAMPPSAGGALADLAVSPTLLATTSGNVLGNDTNLPFGVYIWSLASSSQAAFLSQNSPVVALRFSPDSALLATLNSNFDLNVYNMLTPEPGLIATFNDGANSITSLTGGASIAFSPDLSVIAVGGTDGAVRFWNIANSRLDMILPVLNANGGAVLSVAYSPDGTVLAAAGGFHPALEGDPFPNSDNTIYLWDVSRPARAFQMLRASLTGHTAAVTGLAFAPSGSTLSSVGADGTWRIWGAGGEIFQPPSQTTTGSTPVVPTAVVTNPIGAACPNTTFFFGASGDCVTGDAVDVPGVYQLFEGGIMLWRGDTKSVLVLYNDLTARTYPDTWAGETIITDILPPVGRVVPERGFGWVWVQQPGVRDALGWAFAPEQSYTLRTQSGHVSSPDPVPPGVEYYTLPDGGIIRVVIYEGGMTWSSQ